MRNNPKADQRVGTAAILTGDELQAGENYTLYRNEQGVPNGDTWLASKYVTETEKGKATLVVRHGDGACFFATREDIFTS